MTVSQTTFDHYFTYDEMVQFLNEMAKKYPRLMELESIGKNGRGAVTFGQ